ncbi:DNA topoisomerase II-binding protein [Chloropicon primus]|nr:DNA topoisomerase II-binding protein [Chloropicon primus]
MSQGNGLPQGEPFEGTRVLTAGLGKRKTEDVEQMVRDLGGKLLKCCSASEPPHILIAGDVRSSRYLEVLSIAKTPVLKVDWIYACYKARKQLPYSGFRVPALSGLIVCVTGVDQARRPGVQATVEGAGGKYTRDLVKNTTHLIAVSTQSAKYERACTWKGTHVVSLQWLYDSVQNKTRLNEKKYPVQPTTNDELNALNRLAAAEDKKGRGQVGRGSLASSRTATSPSSLRLYCFGMDSGELKRTKTLARQLGAARFEAFDLSVTHVIAGRQGKFHRKDLDEVSEHVRSGPGVLANMDWLEECNKNKAVVALDVQPEPLLSSLEKRLKPNSRKSLPNGSQGLDCEAGVPGPIKSSKGHQLVASDGVFGGMRFWFYQLANPEEFRAKELVLSGGGSWEGNLERAQPSHLRSLGARDYVVFQESCKDIPPEIQRSAQVTMQWLRESVEKKVLPNEGRCILYRPLTHSTPLLSFSKVNLCASQYPTTDRQVLYDLVRLLGGKADDCMLRNSTTHLLIPEASGNKYNKCEKWGIHTVTAEWLLDSATQGKKLWEGGYKPKGQQRSSAQSGKQSSLGSKRVGFDEVLSKKVVFHKTEVRVNQKAKENHEKVLEPVQTNFSPRRQTRSSFTGKSADPPSTIKDYNKVSGKPKSASKITQGSSMQDVAQAIDKIEGLFQNSKSPTTGISVSQKRTRSRSQMEQKQLIDEPDLKEDSMPDFDSSQRVTYGSDSIIQARKKRKHPASVRDVDFAKKVLGKAVTSIKRKQAKKADDLKDFGLI